MSFVKSSMHESPWNKPAMVAVMFYVIVPSFIGAAFVPINTPPLSQWPLTIGTAYGVAQVVLGWCIKDWFCLLVARAVKPRGASLLTVLIIGSMLAHLIIFPFNLALQSTFELVLLPPEVHMANVNMQSWLSDPFNRMIWALYKGALPAVMVWVAVSLIFFHILGMPRYGYVSDRDRFVALMPAKAEVTAQPEAPNLKVATGFPTFVDLLPLKLRGKRIIAVKAEEHYVRVITCAGEGLIHERFRSVIGEFERFGGVKVHRSYAINPDFVSRIETSDGLMHVMMINDFRAPVSRSYIGVARKLSGQIDRKHAVG